MKPVIGTRYIVQYRAQGSAWDIIWDHRKNQELSFDTVEEARNEVKEWGCETRILKSEITVVT